MNDHWQPEVRHWPTHSEVRDIVQAIIKHIDETPDWSPPPDGGPGPVAIAPGKSTPRISDEEFFERRSRR